MSATGLEQAVVAPIVLARSSTIPQFSGPLRPLPAEILIKNSNAQIIRSRQKLTDLI